MTGFVSDVLESSGLKRRKTPSAEELQRQNILNTITPFGSAQLGSVNEAGEFVPAADVGSIRISETAPQAAIRGRQENLSQELFNLLGGGINVQPNITPRSADEIRRILPSAQASNEGLADIRSSASIEAGLSPFVRTEDFGDEISRLEDATFESVATRLRPDFENAENRLVQSLSDRGIPLESRAAQLELEGLREQQSDALTQAAFGATAAGRAEQDRLARLGLATRGQQVGEGLSLAGLESATRGQLFQENRLQLQDALNKQLQLSRLESAQRAAQFGEREQGLREVGALLSLGTPFQGNITNTGAGNNAAALAAGASGQQSGALSQTVGAISGAAGLGFGGGSPFGGGVPQFGTSASPGGFNTPIPVFRGGF